MANNTTLNAGSGGDVIQSIDNTSYKTQVVAIGDSTGANFAGVTAGGFMKAIIEGTGAKADSSTQNPVVVGSEARTTNPTAVADAQVSRVITDKVGRLVVAQGHVRELVGVQTTTITSSTSETTVVTAGGSGVFCDLTSLSITNSETTQGSLVTLKDATAGTTRGQWWISASGGVVVTFNPPLPQASANNNWTITCDTSVTSIYVNAVYTKNI